nr:MAG TPA: hypothetical protein [Caudoviricetes sp.]
MRGGVEVGNLSDPCHMRATLNVYIFIHAMHTPIPKNQYLTIM